MKRLTMTIFTALALAVNACADLVPETLTITNNRTEVSAYVNTNIYLAGTALRLTNCLAVGSDATTNQDLTSCGVWVRVGSERTNLLYEGTVMNATGGTWTASVTIPVNASGDSRIQVTLTNGATSFTYRGDKLIYVRSPLD